MQLSWWASWLIWSNNQTALLVELEIFDCDDKWNQNLMLAGPLSQQPPRSRWGRFLCNFPAVANLAPCPRFPFVLPSRLGPSVQVPSNILNLDIIKGCALKGLLDWLRPLKASNQTLCFRKIHKQYILALHNPFLFSLEPSHKFHIQRKTTNMGVTFYVKDNFRLKPLNWFWKHAFFSHGWGFKEKCHSFGIFIVDLLILPVFLGIFYGVRSSFRTEYTGSVRKLERQIEEEYIQHLRFSSSFNMNPKNRKPLPLEFWTIPTPVSGTVASGRSLTRRICFGRLGTDSWGLCYSKEKTELQIPGTVATITCWTKPTTTRPPGKKE